MLKSSKLLISEVEERSERRISFKFRFLLRTLLSEDDRAILLKSIRAGVSIGSIDQVLDAMPALNGDLDALTLVAKDLQPSYRLAIKERSNIESDIHGFSHDVSKDIVGVPAGDSVAEFVRNAALTRVLDVSDKEKDRIRTILIKGISEGATSTSMADEIFDTVGITRKQKEMLDRKIGSAIDGGLSKTGAKKLRKSEAAKIRIRRAKAIARTETTGVMVRGMLDSWERATQNGEMPDGAEKEWVAMPFETGRSSKICQALNGQRVPINGDFSTSVDGGFTGKGAPAHVNCRSTVVLRLRNIS